MDWDEINRARQRLSSEEGATVKDWGGRIPFALIYPNTYYVGMSNLGLHAVYRLLNSYQDFLCERAFREKDIPRQSTILSIESQRPLTDFAVLAFTISYELDYFNVVHILKSCGIPLYAAERDERHPLVIAGGPCVMSNPAPLAPFFDCLCIGEAESILPALLPVLKEGIGGQRPSLLKALASLPGVFVPNLHTGNKVVRQWLKNLDESPAHSVVLTRDTELGDLFLIEVERGCNWGCRFCLVSSAFHPMRYRSVDSIVEQARMGLKYRKRLGLVGPVVSDHPRLDELLAKLSEMGAGISVSSLRVRPLPSIMLGELARGGTQTVVLAPEAGAQRLRQVIKKGINEEDILLAAEKVAREKVKHLKLYFMIGLPTETDEDMQELVNLTLKCKSILDKHQSGIRTTINIAPFVPKAGTPFQWLPMAQTGVLNHRLSLVKNALRPKRVEVKHESPSWSEIQAVLSRGDSRVAETLASVEEASLSGWREAAEKTHLDVDFYAHRMWETTYKLPWEMLESGIKPDYLESQLQKALSQSYI